MIKCTNGLWRRLAIQNSALGSNHRHSVCRAQVAGKDPNGAFCFTTKRLLIALLLRCNMRSLCAAAATRSHFRTAPPPLRTGRATGRKALLPRPCLSEHDSCAIPLLTSVTGRSAVPFLPYGRNYVGKWIFQLPCATLRISLLQLSDSQTIRYRLVRRLSVFPV